MGVSGDSDLSGFVAFGYCFALVSVVTWPWPPLTVRNTCLQIPTAEVSQSEQHFWAGIQRFFCALSPCFPFCVHDLWTEEQLTLCRPKHEFTAFWMIFFFLFFLLLLLSYHCSKWWNQMHCSLPTKKFILHQSSQLYYFKTQDSQVEIVVLF